MHNKNLRADGGNDLAAALKRWATFNEAMAQPSVWRAWAGEIEGWSKEVLAWIRRRQPTQIWFCGAGTSAFIGDTLAAYLMRPDQPISFRSIPTTDLVSTPQRFIRPEGHVLVVSFSRSGNSSETVGTLDLLDKVFPSADRLNVTCNPDGALAQRSYPGPGEQKVVVLPAQTHDSGFAMTSSYSTMLLSALACLDDRPPLPVADAFGRLADAGEAVIQSALRIAGSEPPSRAVFLGCGALTGAARESALKVLELTKGQVPTAWDSTLGFRHGPKAVVDGKARVHVLVSGDRHTARYDLDAAEEIRQQFGAEAVVAVGQGQPDIGIPLIGNDAWSSVLYVLPAQIQAIAWSESLGLNVDNPFADNTLSRVVNGVRLYPFQPVT